MKSGELVNNQIIAVGSYGFIPSSGIDSYDEWKLNTKEMLKELLTKEQKERYEKIINNKKS
jgi:hypothetical protein